MFLVADAKAKLNCTACDASEGIFIGDVTDKTTMMAAMAGVDSVVCAVGVSSVSNDTLVKDVEWLGVENQVAALAKANAKTNPDVNSLYFSLISCKLRLLACSRKYSLDNIMCLCSDGHNLRPSTSVVWQGPVL